jgi:putative transposase
MTAAKKTVPKELLDSLLADYREPEYLISEHGLLKQDRVLIERKMP